MKFKKKIRHNKSAFTLAEVLITLGIIGVVAALTLPMLLAQHRKSVVETRLAKFYSTMSQANAMATADYGDITEWGNFETIKETDENGVNQPIANTEFFNKYFAPYIKTLKTEVSAGGKIVVYFPDGSLASFSGSGIVFYPEAKDFKALYFDETKGEYKGDLKTSGIKYFSFFFGPTKPNKYHHNKGVEPYKMSWDGKRETLFTNTEIGCQENVSNIRAYCTALIQLNGWKIPKDYPFKF